MVPLKTQKRRAARIAIVSPIENTIHAALSDRELSLLEVGMNEESLFHEALAKNPRRSP